MPAIQPNTPLEPSYNIAGSKAFVANVQLNFNDIARNFTISFPDPAPAGLAIEFARITAPGGSLDLIALAATPGRVDDTSIPGRAVRASSSSAGGITSLTCNIQDPSEAGVLNEHYEIRTSAGGPVAWAYTVDNAVISRVIRLVCDPVASYNGLPGSLLEKELLTLTANNAVGPSATPTVVRNTSTANGLIVLPAPVPTYRFGFDAPISILGLPSQPQTSQSYQLVDEFDEPVPLPGVYAPTPVPFTVDVVFPNIGGAALLTNRGTANSTINARPQRVQLILDRSGSMGAEHRWDNAKTAARIFINFFGEFRAGVNADDLIGVTVFSDPLQTFRSSDPAGPPFITDVIPLDSPDKVASGDLGPGVFGLPNNATPIGDGLYFGLQKLQERGFPPNVHFTVALMSDGEENCGRIKISPGPDPLGGNPITFDQAKQEAPIREIINSGALNLYTIALGSAPNFPVLDALVARRHFVAALNVSNLINGYATMFSDSQEANKLETRRNRVDTDPPSSTEVFFDTTQAQRFGVAVLKKLDAAPTEVIDAVEIALFDGQDFQVQGINAIEFEGHFYIGVPNASAFGDDGSATWRIRRFNNGTAQPIVPEDVIAFEDLHVKSALSLDKKSYLTGEEMKLAVEIRNDARPVLGATVRAVLDAPAEGTGSLLSALDADDLQRQQRRMGGEDQPAPRQAMIEAVLAKYDWDGLPRCNPDPGGLFVDGSSELHDVDGDGIYTNTFDKVNADGVYNWTLFVSGVDAANKPFNHQLDQSTLAAVSISRKRTTIRQEKLRDQPPGFTAVKVTITPQDDFRELLGPGFDNVVIWSIRGDAVFEHVKNKVPPPVNTDGTYTRTVIFRRRERPTLLVSVRGVILPTIDLTDEHHHFDDDDRDD
ncbi:vWA domain-containing protein [Flindersiella endophytica]